MCWKVFSRFATCGFSRENSRRGRRLLRLWQMPAKSEAFHFWLKRKTLLFFLFFLCLRQHQSGLRFTMFLQHLVGARLFGSRPSRFCGRSRHYLCAQPWLHRIACVFLCGELSLALLVNFSRRFIYHRRKCASFCSALLRRGLLRSREVNPTHTGSYKSSTYCAMLFRV